MMAPDVLRFMAEQLARTGDPFEIGREVDCAPLFTGLAPGEGYAELNFLLDRMQSQGLIAALGSMGQGWALITRGAARARAVYVPEATRESLRNLRAMRLKRREASFTQTVNGILGAMGSQ